MGREPNDGQIARGMKRAVMHVSPLSAVAYRATSVAYANRDDLLTGLGAKRNGARWNPPDSFAAVYTSLTPETAVSEYLAQQRHFGFCDADALPCVLVGIEVRLSRALDLTSDAVRSALGVSEARMLDSAWRAAKHRTSLTQAIGRLAFEAELEGLLVQSAAVPGEKNLVVFPGNLKPPAGYLRAINRQKLPASPHSGD